MLPLSIPCHSNPVCPPPPTHCRLTTYVGRIAAYTGGLVLSLLLATPAAAQPTPPLYPTGNNTFYWSFDAYTSNWGTGDNWYNEHGPYNGIVPIDNADIVLGVMGLGDDPQALYLGSQRKVRSLWFGNEANYTISGTVSTPLLLGEGLANNGHLITVLAEDADPARVHTISAPIVLQAGTKTFQIGNYSPGTLRFLQDFDAKGNSLKLINLGTLDFAKLSNLADLTITDSATTTFEQKVTATGDFSLNNAQTTLNDLTITDSDTTTFEQKVTATGDFSLNNAQTTRFKREVSGVNDLTITDSDTTTFDRGVTATGDFSLNNAQATHFKGEVSGINDLTITDSDTTTFDRGVKVANAVVIKNSRLTIFGSRPIYQDNSGLFLFTTTGKTLSVSSDLADRISTVLLYGQTAQPGFSNSINVGANALLVGRRAIMNKVNVANRGTFYQTHSTAINSITLSGDGVTRQDGTDSLGALYATRIGSTSSATTVHLNGATSINVGSNQSLYIMSPITEATNSSVSSLKKSGSGHLQLNKTGTWKGTTIIDKGTLTLYGANTALPTGNLVLNGGILQFGYQAADFSRTLGTGTNEVRWTGDGGFSAYANDVSVSLGAGGLTWGSGNFVPNGSALLLGSRFGTHQISLTNAINLGSELREVRVERGFDNYSNATSLGRLSGALSGTGGGIEKTGHGLLWILGPAKTYTGATLIREGALRGTIPAASNLQLDGGVFGVQSGTFTRALGTGNNHIQWIGSGGFAAYGNADRSVRLGGSTAEIAWGAANFVQNGDELRFGHYTADRAVIWDKELSLGDAMRTIRVERGKTANTPDVIFAQALKTSATTGGLRLVGDGRADLNANNAALSSTQLEISGAELRIAKPAARLGPVGNIALSGGGRLVIDNTVGTTNSTAQVAATTKITLNSGELHYHAHNAATSSAIVGNVALESGANTIGLHKHASAAATQTVTLNVSALQRAATALSTLNIATRSNITATDELIKAGQALSNYAIGGIVPWATVNGNTWARIDGQALKPFTAYDNSNRKIVLNSAGFKYMPLNVNSLHVHVEWGSQTGWKSSTIHNLSLGSGGLLFSGDLLGRLSIHNITTAQNRPLYIHSYNHSSTAYAPTLSLGGNYDTVKIGPGAVRLGTRFANVLGARSLYVYEGLVALYGFNNSGSITIGDGSAKRAELQITGAGNLPNKQSVTLHGTPYGRGAAFGPNEPQAILTLKDTSNLSLSELKVIDRGTIQFEYSHSPSYLFLDKLIFNNTSAQLFVRGWQEYESYLLVKKTAFVASLLKQIYFDGYSPDFPLLNEDYNADYYQITPFATITGAPEPATYGAILGAVGFALVAWRRRMQRRAAK